MEPSVNGSDCDTEARPGAGLARHRLWPVRETFLASEVDG